VGDGRGVVEAAGDVETLRSERFQESERAAQVVLGRGEVSAALGDQGEVVEAVGERDARRRPLFVDGKRAAEERFRAVEVPPLPGEDAEVLERLRDLQAARGEGLADLESSAVVPLRLRGIALPPCGAVTPRLLRLSATSRLRGATRRRTASAR
jgi:hypothetical protein